MEKNNNLEVLISRAEIAERVKELGAEISRDYHEGKLFLVTVLKGAVVFLADLIRNLQIPVEIDFIAVSSYGGSTKSSGIVRILKDLDYNIKGRDVLVVEDIVDTGLTLQYLCEYLLRRQPQSLRVAALLDKPGRRKVEIKPDYCGFTIPDCFVVGYGLDFDGDYRYLADIKIIKEEDLVKT